MKNYKTKAKKAEVKEPEAGYTKRDIPFQVFSSFEEENEYVAKQRAALSHDERMENAEKLRQQVFSEYLLPNGKWKPVERVFKKIKPYTNEIN